MTAFEVVRALTVAAEVCEMVRATPSLSKYLTKADKNRLGQAAATMTRVGRSMKERAADEAHGDMLIKGGH